MATLLPRRVVGTLSALLLSILAVAGMSAPAQAEEGYQYWGYYHLEGDAWAFSQVGAADFTPEDGAVEGFRYGTSTTSQPIEPRADLGEVSFDSVCGDTEPATGEKRVAVVIDYGLDEGAGTPPEPRADCAVVAADASTQQALEGVAQARVEGGMVCAIDGYPETGCGVPVANPEVAADQEPVAFALPSDDSGDSDAAAREEAQRSGTPWSLVGVAAAVVLIAVGALAMARRNRAA